MQVLQQLVEIVRIRDSFALILPEMIMANEQGEVSLRALAEGTLAILPLPPPLLAVVPSA